MKKPYKIMNELSRQHWVKTLKPGDKVINILDFEGENPIYEELQIKSITSKGNIMLTNGLKLDSKGTFIDSVEGCKMLKDIDEEDIYVCIIYPHPKVYYKIQHMR